MIDAHQHVWELGRHGCSWPTPMERAIFRSYDLHDFRAVARPHGVRQTILVQSQEDESDTDWLLELAAEDKIVAAVVGWTDLAAPGAPARVAALADRPRLAGLRPMVQDRDADFYDDPALDPALAAMADHKLSLDALVRVPHLAALDRLAARHPRLAIVIDHGAKPRIADRDGFTRWHKAIAPLADRSNVSCKLSGLLTECAGKPPAAINRYVETMLDLFGPERLMWGSDWPVLDMVSSYGDWLAMARWFVPERYHDDVFERSAATFYRIGVEGAGA